MTVDELINLDLRPEKKAMFRGPRRFELTAEAQHRLETRLETSYADIYVLSDGIRLATGKKSVLLTIDHVNNFEELLDYARIVHKMTE